MSGPFAATSSCDFCSYEKFKLMREACKEGKEIEWAGSEAAERYPC